MYRSNVRCPNYRSKVIVEVKLTFEGLKNQFVCVFECKNDTRMN